MFMEELTKVCTKCGKELTLDNFHKEKAGKYGVTSKCKSCRNAYNVDYRKVNVDKIKSYRKSIRNKALLYFKQRYENNKEVIREKQRQYNKNNRAIRNAAEAKRQATKLNQTPVLTTEEQQTIKLYYKLSTSLGRDYHVDHIIPLSKGGLHHPDNLQILCASDNLSKSDKLDYTYIHTRYVIQDGQLIKISGAKND